jgi:hypothetical protein
MMPEKFEITGISRRDLARIRPGGIQARHTGRVRAKTK